MNREQAIAASKYLRKGTTVADLRPADKDNGIDEPYWVHTPHETISAAKRTMRKLGRGVALKAGERLPQETPLEASN